MTRYTDEWLDAKLANIQRWKAQEAARSAAKQSTSGGVETSIAGEPGLSSPGAGASSKVLAPISTAGAASPAGVPSNPVAAPAPDDVQWICAPCGARHCNGMRDEHIATWHIGRCDICADETAVTEPRDFGYLKATKADAATDRTLSDKSANGQRRTVPSLGGAAAASSGTHKYRNKPTDGYHSKREARRAAALRLMQEAGQIRDLREQVEFLLIPRQTRPDGTAERSCSYWADFVYDEWTADGWRRVVEDVKGMRTREYVLKRKLMLMVHGVAIREV